MTAATQDDFIVTSDWDDLVVERPAINGQSISIQIQTNDIVFVVAGGAAEPSNTKTGWKLGEGDELTLEAVDHVWVRTRGDGGATISLSII